MSFDKAVEFVLKYEGGYIYHPADPGGETNFGISKRAYPQLDIKNLTAEHAKNIYRYDYWQKAGCEKLDWPLSLIVFDTAVNMGLARAAEFKAKTNNPTDYLLLRMAHYVKLKKPAFLGGWINRCIDLYWVTRQ